MNHRIEAAPQAAHVVCEDFIEVTDDAEWDRLITDAAFFNAVADFRLEEEDDDDAA